MRPGETKSVRSWLLKQLMLILPGRRLRSVISGHFLILPSAFFLSVFVLVEIKRSAGMMAGFAISSLITSVRVPIIAPRTVSTRPERLLTHGRRGLEN
jgi:hypothetical protein